MDEKLVKDAQYRKGLSIAFFNATNAAIEMVKSELENDPTTPPQKVQERMVFWRDWLLEEHKSYYSNVIAKIGGHFSVKDTVEKLKATTTLISLRAVWLGISADERAHPDIVKVAQEMKAKLTPNEKA